jgi:hypothetical protein
VSSIFDQLGDLSGAKYCLEASPANEGTATSSTLASLDPILGKTMNFVPFSLKLHQATLPTFIGQPQAALDRLYLLLHAVTREYELISAAIAELTSSPNITATSDSKNLSSLPLSSLNSVGKKPASDSVRKEGRLSIGNRRANDDSTTSHNTGVSGDEDLMEDILQDENIIGGEDLLATSTTDPTTTANSTAAGADDSMDGSVEPITPATPTVPTSSSSSSASSSASSSSSSSTTSSPATTVTNVGVTSSPNISGVGQDSFTVESLTSHQRVRRDRIQRVCLALVYVHASQHDYPCAIDLVKAMLPAPPTSVTVTTAAKEATTAIRAAAAALGVLPPAVMTSAHLQLLATRFRLHLQVGDLKSAGIVLDIIEAVVNQQQPPLPSLRRHFLNCRGQHRIALGLYIQAHDDFMECLKVLIFLVYYYYFFKKKKN